MYPEIWRDGFIQRVTARMSWPQTSSCWSLHWEEREVVVSMNCWKLRSSLGFHSQDLSWPWPQEGRCNRLRHAQNLLSTKAPSGGGGGESCQALRVAGEESNHPPISPEEEVTCSLHHSQHGEGFVKESRQPASMQGPGQNERRWRGT